MKFPIVSSSPRVQAGETQDNNEMRYPFNELECGQSFTAQQDEVNMNSLRVCVSKKNAREAKKENGKQFTFVRHDNLGIVEIARIK